MAYEMPNPEDVQALLEMVFGDGLAAEAANDAGGSGEFAATFIDDDDKLVAACLCDPAFVAYAGSAMSMIPAPAANDMIKDGDFSEAILLNFHEVMNICSKLMMSEGSDHLRLDKTFSPDAAAAAIADLQGSSRAASFALDIPRYGQGKLSVLVV